MRTLALIFIILSTYLFASASLAEDARKNMNISATVSDECTMTGENGLLNVNCLGGTSSVVDVVSGETGTSSSSTVVSGQLVSGGSGSATQSFAVSVDTSTLSESKQYDFFIQEYVPQVLKEDLAIKSNCSSRKDSRTGGDRAVEQTKVTVTW